MFKSRCATVRASLLVSLGLLPVACSGRTTTRGDHEPGGAGSGGASGTGNVTMAGSAGKVTGTGGAVTGTSGAPTGTGGGLNGTGGAGGVAGAAVCTPGSYDEATQLLHCADQGYYTRPMAGHCLGGADGPRELPRADGTTACQSHDECGGYALGYCSLDAGECVGGIGAAPAQSGVCRSGCTTDADCNEDALCVCSGAFAVGTCVNADCRTDADCGAGSVCASIEQGALRYFRCTRPNDECMSAMDCEATHLCRFVDEWDRRACVERPDCGRP